MSYQTENDDGESTMSEVERVYLDELQHYMSAPTPKSRERQWAGHVFKLEIVQQPVRARMCGFGDKDRRPISPPLILRLVVVDPATNEEIRYDNKNPEWANLIVGVDLYDGYGIREDNAVRHNSPTPALSSTLAMTSPITAQPSTWTVSESTLPTLSTLPALPALPTLPYPPAAPMQRGSGSRSSQDTVSTDGKAQELSKNLIGQCVTSSQKLEDPQKVPGLYFIFQDLSVRTEGWFRLKCELFALGSLDFDKRQSEVDVTNGLLLEGPCLAMIFSAPFKVFSAKKFPGVVETTQVSQIFADQGIKIPIRKPDNKKKKENGTKGDNGND